MAESGLYGIPKRQDPNRSEISVNKAQVPTVNTACVSYSLMYSAGSDITYLKSTAAGDAFLINTPGAYAMTMADGANSGATVPIMITRNALATELTGNPAFTSLDPWGRPCLISFMFGTANGTTLSTQALCFAGDIIRPQYQTGTLSAVGSTAQYFRITRIS